MTDQTEELLVEDMRRHSEEITGSDPLVELPAHSPLGASGAERWINCPGSVALIKAVQPQLLTDDDPEYRREGTAAHAAAAWCLSKGHDAWEMGDNFMGVDTSVEMCDAVQMYLDHVRPLMAAADKSFIEYKMHEPGFHPAFFGTIDFGAVRDELLDVVDFKYGEGVLVPVLGNQQCMYYAYGLLLRYQGCKTIRMTIIQPRITWQNPIRTWVTTREELESWAHMILKPAMDRAETESGLQPGQWCRFCPAKLVCPALKGLFGAAALADPDRVVDLTDDELNVEYPLVDTVKMYIKALEAEVYVRLQHGHKLSHIKLVKKKGERVWKPGAEAAFLALDFLTTELRTEPAFKSPAQIEKLGTNAKKLTKEWAYLPETGLTVALVGDGRPEVIVKSMAEAFPGAVSTNDGEVV